LVWNKKHFLGAIFNPASLIRPNTLWSLPLHRLTEKNVIFKWTQECEDSFNILKHALTSSPILIYPCLEKEFILDTELYQYIWLQGSLLSVSHFRLSYHNEYSHHIVSRTNPLHCRRELLAIVQAVRHFHHYLYGVPFQGRTDHGALTWLLNFKNSEGQLARWLE
jgi:hypothetical protein